MTFAGFRKAFKKPESVIPITKEQMKLFMGEEPEVKCHLVEINKEHGKLTGFRYAAIRKDGTCDEPKDIFIR
ncbi:hypothetical protein [Bacillus wiedmannii]|uniref:hypothetical protein n=1 Tax=Bacillus wiedmannii TaxID=1890302 RepID=UPI000BFC3DF0|nr:hypothetical protein [Bacillus wiedmannii]PHE70866.1 hypothetical protein COF77_24930 [Bacillus wiedmannii]